MEAIDVQLQLPFSFLPASAPAGRLRHYDKKETISGERTHRHQGLRAFQKKRTQNEPDFMVILILARPAVLRPWPFSRSIRKCTNEKTNPKP
jgi:hypothetical protein